MKYILLMSGMRAGVGQYHAWSKQDSEAQMAVLQRINKDPTPSGEFVATQGLAEPSEAKVVRGEKNRVPLTDGIFPQSKEFLLGYWIVDVAKAERAYAIAGQISAAPGPGANPQTCRSKCGGSRRTNPSLNKRDVENGTRAPTY